MDLKKKRRFAIWSLISFTSFIFAIAVMFYMWSTQPITFKHSKIEIVIEPQTTFRQTLKQLKQEGVNLQPYLFEILARFLKMDRNIKAGDYILQPHMTPYSILKKFSSGDFDQAVLTIIEGWTFAQMRAEMDQNEAITHDTKLLTHLEILKRIDAKETHPEGLFFPDTYLFPKGTSDIEIYKRAYQTAKFRLQTAWESRSANLPYKNSYDALIMASIIEKESAHPEDRLQIAGVFVNRLRKGMRLQTDPTVIYGLTTPLDKRLRRHDLEKDTVYNTYKRRGLPPTPIALPSAAAIHAALNPANTNALFFVARGDGTSHFSVTLDAHNNAVNKFIRGR